MPVTMAEVAAAAGVSVMTVSYAFSRPERVSAGTRERVHRVARELGYAGPDPGARALRTRRTGTIGVVLGEHLTYAFEDPQATRFLAGVASVCVSAGLGLTLIPVTGGPSDPARVREAAVDGYVVWTTGDDDPVLEVVTRRPTVVFGGPAVPGAGLVTIDDRAAAEAVGRAVFRGARRPAVVSFPLSRAREPGLLHGPDPATASFPVTRHRLAGYRDALVALGVAWTDVPVLVLARNDPAEAASRFADLGAVDAVAAMGDQVALALPRGGFRLSGWDDAAGAAEAGLTTIRQSLRDQGAACARQLVEGTLRTALAEWELVERASSSV
ncbi:LacI family DNA-binding transcriptional regulator [Symbioplanes lichenis]|uniref:LacI family DNA-binding transcriptional regulator n=1 Tax=Symbioplanes lichenis TaxID=1629072 RepID=UPI00273825A9|nr:LacI family DNA-binding transcriptional regulator [Actinoplanes lichenis]